MCTRPILFPLRLFLFVVFSYTSPIAHSQVYPVQVSAQLSPPYSAYLKDYAEPGSEKLKVILQLNDLSVAFSDIKLHFEIKGNGYSLSTKTFYLPPPVTLYPGQPHLISGSDLAHYLNSNHLDFTGFNQSLYDQNISLPEGYYSICVKAFDYYTNKQISNESCAQGWFIKSDPPLLNLPLCNSVVTPLPVQNITFQWTSMNLGSPNSSFNTEYEFALWECKPDSSANPNQVALNTNPVFSITTQQTSFNYGIAEPGLNLYTKYIWRVRAKDVSGKDFFKNNGYSQVCTFNYGTLNSVLGSFLRLQLTATTVNHRSGYCQWNTQSAFTSYLLQARKTGTEEWFNYPALSGSEKITNLEPNTSYQCRVKGEGTGISGEWSNVAEFTTSAEPNYSCNDQSSPYNTAPSAPLPLIKAIRGLIIQSGQFEIKVHDISASGSLGWYSGKGVVSVFGLKKIPVKWDNIYIDAEARHQQGIIEAVTDGVDKWLQQWDQFEAEQNATYTNGTLDSVFINGNQVCYHLQGNNNIVCVPTPTNSNSMVIRDEEGNQYTIHLNPPPPKVTGPTNFLEYSTDSLAADENKIVVFKESPTQSFGFDKKEYAVFIKNYEVIKLKNGKNYFIPNKSIAESQTDEVLAEIQITNFNPSLLKFLTKEGLTVASVNQSANAYKLTGLSHSMQCVYAVYDGKPVGKLNIIPVKPLTRKVNIVPVNGATISLTSFQLNSMFKQAGVQWTITTAPNFTYDLGTNGLDAADANLLSKYSQEMRQLRNSYQQQDSLYDREAYYLFIVPSFSEVDINGYMVRGRALGFIKAGASVKTVAHELAHGAFGLEHTFPKLEKNTSNNLLDYGTGAQLVKEQWIAIQIGKYSLSWFDEEEDAQYVNTAVGVFYWINKIKTAYKKSAQITIPERLDLIGRAPHCYLAGIQFDSICVYVKYGYSEVQVPARNNITIESLVSGVTTYSAVCVGGDKIIIKAPANRLQVLKQYLEFDNYKNLLLFVNGYRPIVNFNGDPVNTGLEYSDSSNEIEFGDSRNYWQGIDAQFINRIGTRNAVYADGHHSVATSNHGSVGGYLVGNTASAYMKAWCDAYASSYHCQNASNSYLHTTPNRGGFYFRKAKGAEAATNLLRKINEGDIIFNKETDSVDIVAHSMGYAYAIGMVEVLQKANIKFGRFYAVAPENACSGGLDWTYFTEVWQYGSDLGQPNADPPWDQDGVAPQCEVKGVTQLPNSVKGGRVFIPKDFKPKGYLDCHTIKNYGWIFEKPQGKDGYVRPR